MSDPAADRILLEMVDRQKSLLHFIRHVPVKAEFFELRMALNISIDRLHREIAKRIREG